MNATIPKPMTDQEKLDNWFSYHPPTTLQTERYTKIRDAGKAMAKVLLEQCPPSDDRDDAIRFIRAAVFAANASIACGGR